MFLWAIRSLKVQWSITNVSTRVYWIAFLVFAAAVTHSVFIRDYKVGIPFFASFFLFALGFLLRARPVALWIWEKPAGKLFVAIFHALVLIFSVGCAGMVVSDSLGLPSKDFTTTVSLLSVWLYPFVWLVITAILLLPVAFLFQFSLLLLMLAKLQMVNSFLLFIAERLSDKSRFWQFIESGRDRAFFDLVGHFIGVLMVSVSCVELWDVNFKALVTHSMIVKILAYKFDYQDLHQYPGIEHGERVVLHDNNVISYAHANGYNITIHVKRYSEVSSDLLLPIIPKN